jgi:hypothetical protein
VDAGTDACTVTLGTATGTWLDVVLGTSRGALPQPASVPTMQATHHHTGNRTMILLLLEALGAGLLLIGIIWWTMFSGRKNGELPDAIEPPDTAPNNDKNGR